MNDLFILLLIGVAVFFMFRKGGMGCCGGHGGHESSDSENNHAGHSASHKEQSQIIDLNEADYSILPSNTKEKQT
jgi:hypothetical protein